MWSPNFVYDLKFTPSPEMDLGGFFGGLRALNDGYVGERKVSYKTVAKRRDRNYAARQARKKNR